MSTISLYPHISQIKNGKDITVDIFLQYIQDGKWQDIVLPIRLMGKEDRNAAKKKVPYVTLSGLFTDRTDAGIKEHSGFVGIDIDDLEDPEDTKGYLCADPYIYAAFVSISGKGLCLLFKINGDRHRDAFAGISEYLYENYNIICDPTSVNPSRPRFISYDPHIYINSKAPKFTIYPKNKAPKKIEKVVFAQTDFDEIIMEIQRRAVDLCNNYHEWLRIGFAISDKFGEYGRSYFHVISQYSYKYNPKDTDKQYTNCLKAKGGKQATIATFYYYCKQAGIQTYSQSTRTILSAAVNLKKSGVSKEAVIKNLEQFEDISPEQSTDIVNQTFENNIDFSEDNLLVQIEQWLKYNYEMRRNEITRYIENNGKIMTQSDFNSIFIASKKVFDKSSYETIDRLINSDFTPCYNPVKDFFTANKDRNPSGVIDRLFDTLLSEDFNYNRYFGKKWLVGIISSVHGEHSPLMLVLSGSIQGTGKTEWLRRLLPKQLQVYYAESKLDAGKDDEILMTQKIIIMDDEMGGKNKREEKKMKELLSRQTFSLREPYGRNNVDLNRIAVLCGTTNDEAILSDPTGNRRILPIPVFNINQQDYNRIDKIDVFIEAYNLWKSGYNWRLTSDDVKELNIKTVRFEKFSSEYELILKFFRLPRPEESSNVEYLTGTEIKNKLETSTVQKLSLDKIGKEMHHIGFEQITRRVDNMPRKVYKLVSVVGIQATTDF